MKKVLASVLVLSSLGLSSLSAKADCTNAYLAKAEQRAVAIKNWKKAGVVSAAVVVGVGGIVVAPTLLLPTLTTLADGGVVALEMGASALTVGEIVNNGDVEKDQNNQFFKALAAIEGAKIGMVSADLLDRVSKKLDLESLSTEQKEKTMQQIVNVVADANAKGLFCPVRTRADGIKITKVVKYRQMVDFVVDQVKE